MTIRKRSMIFAGLLAGLTIAGVCLWYWWVADKSPPPFSLAPGDISTDPPEGAARDAALEKNIAHFVAQFKGIQVGQIRAFRLTNHRFIALDEIRVDCQSPQSESIFKKLHPLGYQTLTGHLHAVASIDAGQKRLHLQQMDLSFQGLGQLQLRGVLVNIDTGQFPTWRRQSLALLMALAPVSLGESQWTYTDDSLVQRLSSQNQKNELLASLKHWLTQTRRTESSPRVQQAMDELQAFLNKPDRLTLHSTPHQPVSLLAMMQHRTTAQWMDLLGIQVANGSMR